MREDGTSGWVHQTKARGKGSIAAASARASPGVKTAAPSITTSSIFGRSAYGVEPPLYGLGKGELLLRAWTGGKWYDDRVEILLARRPLGTGGEIFNSLSVAEREQARERGSSSDIRKSKKWAPWLDLPQPEVQHGNVNGGQRSEVYS